MNSRQIKIYRVITVILGVLALLGTVALVLYAVWLRPENEIDYWWVCVAVALLLVFPVNLVVHELGHITFGIFAGLRPVSFRVRFLLFDRGGIHFVFRSGTDGESVLLPNSLRRARGQMIAATLGGAVFNFIYAAVFFVLYFVVPVPAVVFFALFAPLNLYEAIAAIVPAELEAGKTDGAVLRGLKRRDASEEVMLHVLTAQGALFRREYRDLPEELLFGVPVVREDDPYFSILTQLQWQYCFATGDDEGAKKRLSRLEELIEYFPAPEFLCDLAFYHAFYLHDFERASEYLNQAPSQKKSFGYLCVRDMLENGDFSGAKKAVSKQPNGIKHFGLYLIERARERI